MTVRAWFTGTSMDTSSGRRAGGWRLLGLAALLCGVLAVFGNDYQLRFAAEILLVGTAVMSLNVLVGYAGLVSLGHAALFGAAAYGAAVAAQHWGSDLLLMLPVGVLCGMALAALMTLVSYRSVGLFFLVLTLVVGQMTWEVVFRWRAVTGGADGLRGFPALTVAGLPASHPLALYALALTLALACGWVLRAFVSAPVGHAVQGMRDQPLRMRALGFHLGRLRLQAFLVTGAVAGAAGSIYPFVNQYVGPNTVHWSMSATLVIMSVLGGIATLAGGFVGAALYLVAQTQLSSWTDRWQLLIGLLFVLTVIFVPQGIVPALRRRFTS
ncbi:MAG: branched-chain amino acid ABC transporter permease [Burkholderiaceae bacterium]